MSRTWTLAVMVVWTVAGCGGSSGGPGESVPVGTDGVTASDVVVDEPVDATDVRPDTTPPVGAGAAGELVDVSGVTTIAVTTPVSGNGEFPLFEWIPVDGVELYALTLTGSDGQSYWAWSGPETEVYLGGLAEPPPPGSSGPYLFEPMTLRVVGLDPGGNVIAASAATVITP